MVKALVVIATLCACLLRAEWSCAQTTVTYVKGPGLIDQYWADAIKLSLEETKSTYGPFVLDTNLAITGEEQYGSLVRNNLPNLVLAMGYRPATDAAADLTFINFPSELGILGWRICFVNKQRKAQIATIKTKEDLRKFSIVQGIHWADNRILLANKLNLMEAPNPSLIKMVASGRADLFCRGVNELHLEWENNKTLANLDYDESFILVYKMPLFFYMHKTNAAVKSRIQEGLIIAYKNGKLMELWRHHFGSAIKFANIQARKVITLDNNQDGDLAKDYEQYLVNPLNFKLE